MTPPTIGRIVHYRLTELDAERITINAEERGGNRVSAGDVLAAVVVQVWSDTAVNLQVFLDGPGTHWRTSAHLGDEQGSWFWPPRINMTREGW